MFHMFHGPGEMKEVEMIRSYEFTSFSHLPIFSASPLPSLLPGRIFLPISKNFRDFFCLHAKKIVCRTGWLE